MISFCMWTTELAVVALVFVAWVLYLIWASGLPRNGNGANKGVAVPRYPSCCPQERSNCRGTVAAKGVGLYCHGWYSAVNNREIGHFHCALSNGDTVMVTNVTNSGTYSPTGGLAGWPDAVYVGKVVPLG